MDDENQRVKLSEELIDHHSLISLRTLSLEAFNAFKSIGLRDFDRLTVEDLFKEGAKSTTGISVTSCKLSCIVEMRIIKKSVSYFVNGKLVNNLLLAIKRSSDK